MANKRQREARKRFRAEHPELVKTPEPTPPKDPSKKKKVKKPSFKRKRSESGAPNDPNRAAKKSRSKHPLRVPGMKPGDSCFICKGTDHIAKLCPEKAEWDRHKICLFCRQRGHSLKNCQKKNENDTEAKLCYNCGETGHSLSRCPLSLQDGGTKFAKCFVCNETGHLSKDCPKNSHGIYPKGGSCKICGGVTHLARDCPNKDSRNSIGSGNSNPKWNEPRGKVTKFASGDDLEDDFSFIGEKTVAKTVDESAASPGFAVSGLAVNEECKQKFLELKAKRNHRFIIFKIDKQEVVVEKLGEPDETYDDFTASLPAEECRYAVFDLDFTTIENCQKSKIFFIAWSPDTSKVRMKMVYASSKDRFKRELDGIQVELQATDPSELSFDIIKSRAL
ncbi:uncharacterized protein LOC112177860 isoform X2 [Rosa chinensis]|uniref:uncharacterized protein LOC112177860 isoform X2 n=1 Tax=Rosa chinensis TaxID=74649 RepID=UPI000D09717C|nr:uncharacterized protein LOC112177860 isoform X2 [Rosa chinensis]